MSKQTKNIDLFDDDGFDDDVKLDELSEQAKTPLWKIIAKWGGISLGVVLALIIAFIAGSISGKGSASDAPKQVTAIQSQAPILESLDSLRESRIESLNQQIRDAQIKNMDVGEQVKQQQGLLKGQAESQGAVDGFLDHLMSMKNEAGEAEQEVVAKAMRESMTQEAGATTVYTIIQGETPAKVLGENGRRASASSLYPVKVDSDSKTYLVITPFATDSGLYHQVAMVKVAGEKISDFRFVGLLESTNVDAYEKALQDFTA